MFKSEKEMQEWLSDAFKSIHGLEEIIEPFEADTDGMKPEERRVVESFEYCLTSLEVNVLITEDENISLRNGDVLKPDFLLYSPCTESMVIVELKNIANPTRQVGTELGAYSSEIKSHLPFISDGDIIHVVISRDWPTLLKHYLFHEIYWLNRNVLCLEPFKKDDGEINLRVLQSSLISDEALNLKLSEKHLAGYQLCLYDDELYTGGSRERLDTYLEQIKTSIRAMSVKGIIHNSHGFAFLWKDFRTGSLAPYSITILSMAPFQSLERFLHEGRELSGLTEKLYKLVQEEDPMGQGQSLFEITSYGFKFLEGICSHRIEGFHDWGILRDFMLENSELIEFHAWGLFLDKFTDKLATEYKNGNYDVGANDPHLALQMISELIDEEYDHININDLDLDSE